MPKTPTARGAFPRPNGSDPDYPPDDLTALTDRLAAVVALDDQGAFASIPTASAGLRGSYYWATDAQVLLRCNGTSNVVVTAATPLVDTIPTPLVEGQRFAIRPDATNNPAVRWVYERRNNQWMVVDGQPLIAKPSGALTTSSQTPVGLMTAMSVPFKGTYRVRFGARSVTVGSGTEVMATLLYVNGSFSNLVIQESAAAPNFGGPRACSPEQIDLDSGAVLSLRVQATNGVSSAFSAGWVELSPLSVL